MRGSVLAAPLVGLSLTLTACGGGATIIDPVASAADKTTKAGTEHLTLDGAVRARGIATNVTGSGDFDTASGQGHFDLTFITGGVSGSIQEVMSNGALYMRSDLFTGLLPAGKEWVELDVRAVAKELGVDFGALSAQDPGAALKTLKAAGTVTKVGEEQIGFPATHYRVSVDVSKLPAYVRQLTHARYEPMDVWLDDAGFVRRLHARYSFRLAGGARAHTSTTMNFSEFGEAVHVDVPPAKRTVDAASLGIGKRA